MIKRRQSKQISIGDIKIGGDAPISVQSMCNTDTRDVNATLDQINELTAKGCEIVRLAVLNKDAAEAIKDIVKKSPVPLVADIHFDYRLAIQCINNGINALRLNPGNIGKRENVEKVVSLAKQQQIPIRIGVNAGSLEKELTEEDIPLSEKMVKSAMKHIQILEDLDFDLIKVSLKSSDVLTTIEAYRLIAEKMTEEVTAGFDILKSLGLRQGGVNFISCPTCGRTQIDLINLAKRVEEKFKNLDKNITIATMGCAVNGPGEARHADFGIAGGINEGYVFKKGEIVAKVPENELLEKLEEIITKSYE